MSISISMSISRRMGLIKVPIGWLRVALRWQSETRSDRAIRSDDQIGRSDRAIRSGDQLAIGWHSLLAWMYSACEMGMRVSIITRRSIFSRTGSRVVGRKYLPSEGTNPKQSEAISSKSPSGSRVSRWKSARSNPKQSEANLPAAVV